MGVVPPFCNKGKKYAIYGLMCTGVNVIFRSTKESKPLYLKFSDRNRGRIREQTSWVKPTVPTFTPQMLGEIFLPAQIDLIGWSFWKSNRSWWLCYVFQINFQRATKTYEEKTRIVRKSPKWSSPIFKLEWSNYSRVAWALGWNAAVVRIFTLSLSQNPGKFRKGLC